MSRRDKCNVGSCWARIRSTIFKPENWSGAIKAENQRHSSFFPYTTISERLASCRRHLSHLTPAHEGWLVQSGWDGIKQTWYVVFGYTLSPSKYGKFGELGVCANLDGLVGWKPRFFFHPRLGCWLYKPVRTVQSRWVSLCNPLHGGIHSAAKKATT